jgi:hypothetical protein
VRCAPVVNLLQQTGPLPKPKSVSAILKKKCSVKFASSFTFLRRLYEIPFAGQGPRLSSAAVRPLSYSSELHLEYKAARWRPFV